jgi:hypothetical protein
MMMTRSQSYDFRFYNASVAVALVCRAVLKVEENVFVLKTRSAVRGVVNFYSAGIVRTIVGLAPGKKQKTKSKLLLHLTAT